MRLLSREECIAIAAGMTRAWQIGYAAGLRGWASLSDLVLAQSTQPGWADSYQMGLAWGRRDRARIAQHEQDRCGEGFRRKREYELNFEQAYYSRQHNEQRTPPGAGRQSGGNARAIR